MSEDKNNLVDPSNHGAYDTAYSPSPYSAPTNGYSALANPGYSAQSGQQMISSGPTTVSTTVTMQCPVTSNDMHRQFEPMPPNYLTQNILSLFFCSLIFGIIGLVKGKQVITHYMSGKYVAARAASLSARNMYRVGFAVGTIVKTLLIAFVVVFYVL